MQVGSPRFWQIRQQRRQRWRVRCAKSILAKPDFQSFRHPWYDLLKLLKRRILQLLPEPPERIGTLGLVPTIFLSETSTLFQSGNRGLSHKDFYHSDGPDYRSDVFSLCSICWISQNIANWIWRLIVLMRFNYFDTLDKQFSFTVQAWFDVHCT